jgi:hypothetical protein
MNQFERLQRQRSGEYVPPPVSINVNVSGLEPDGHVDALHDVSEIPGTIVVAVSADADDLNPASCPETAGAPETKEPKELTVQDDGVRLAESGSSGTTFELEKHHGSGEEAIPGVPEGVAEAPQGILPNEPTAASVPGLGG